MALVRAFKAIRPTKELVEKVAALPYDVMNSEEAREMVVGNEYSFLHIDKAEIDFDKNINVYDEKVYEKARENLNNMISNKTLVKDKQACLYIYKLSMNGRSQTGLVACTSIDEYVSGVIKKHELTREDKELDRIKHVDYCNANTGPIFLAYKEKKEINQVIENWVNHHAPIYDFVSDDQVGHTVWVIEHQDVINELVRHFNEVPSLYIADGHHRNASAVKVGLKRRQENPNYGETCEFNYYLSVIFPDEQLKIMDYNRVVKDLNNLTYDEFMSKVREKFDIEILENQEAFSPKVIHTFGMYLENKWYKLTAKKEIIKENDSVQCLDVSILQNELLQPILGIKDMRTDKRIDFVGGIRGISELTKRVNSGEMKIAFSMFPTSMSELMNVADAGEIMPPKSTWFEPKLRSGIFIHSLE